MDGGTLKEFCSRNRIDEDLGLYLFAQLAFALSQCHALGVAYRDVKLENVLLSADSPPVLKLCDFGTSRHAGGAAGGWAGPDNGRADFSMHTFAGTPGFASPQVLSIGVGAKGAGDYDGAKSDVWSAGVLLHTMLTGRLPFDFDEQEFDLNPHHALQAILQASCAGRWRDAPGVGPARARAMLSDDALDLLDHMLEREESARYTVAQVSFRVPVRPVRPIRHVRPVRPQVLAHPWVSRWERLPPPHGASLRSLAEAQAKLDRLAPQRAKGFGGHGDAMIEAVLRRAQRGEERRRSVDQPGAELVRRVFVFHDTWKFQTRLRGCVLHCPLSVDAGPPGAGAAGRDRQL